MPLVTAMRDLFSKFTTTEDSTSERFGTTGAYIHVGSSTAAFNSNQNSMQGTSTDGTFISSMDGGFPTRGTNVLTYRATYTTSEANFQWDEIGVKNTTATSTGTGTLMQRLLSTDMGLKNSNQSWQVTLTNTITTAWALCFSMAAVAQALAVIAV